MKPSQRIIQLLRFGGLFALIAVLLNAGLLALDRQPNWSFLPQDPRLERFNQAVEVMAQRVHDVEQWYALGKPGADRPLCVVYGLSTVRDGFNAEVLEREAETGGRFLVLGGRGSTGMLAFDAQIQPLLESPLRPDLVVLGIHPFFLSAPAEFPLENDKAEAEDPGLLRRIYRRLRQQVWVTRRQPEMLFMADRLLGRTRQHLMEELKEEEEAMGEADPLAPLAHASRAAADPDNVIDPFEERGWYELETYVEHHAYSMERLLDAISRLRAKGTRVALVLMPEKQHVRESIPPEVQSMLMDPLRDRFSEEEVPVVDFNTVLPDSEFSDYGHADITGQERLSTELAGEIPRLLAEPAPPVAVGSMETAQARTRGAPAPGAEEAPR